MITYTGIHVTREFGAPSVQDIAVQTMRLVRFCGAGRVWWPVGMHLLLVADLCGPDVEHHFLLHDGAEAVMNDTPRPMKTKDSKALEGRVFARMYDLLGLKLPTAKEAELIHAADIRAVNVEGCCGPGPRGFEYTQPDLDFDDPMIGDPEAFNRLHWYLEQFKPEDAINPVGKWPVLLERRLRLAITRAHNNVKHRNGYLKAA